MIKVLIVRDKTGLIRRISVKGHSGYDEAGKDIVCAAVSAVAYTAAGAMEDLVGIKGFWREKDGKMEIRLPRDIGEESRKTAGIILETAAIGFKQIQLGYEDFVSVTDEEV